MRDAPDYKVPVVLIAGCTAGVVVLILLVVLTVVLCCRRKKKRQERKTAMKHDAASIPNKDGRNDDCLSMENELYCSSKELSKSPELKNLKLTSDVEKDNGNARIVSDNGNARNVKDVISKTSVIAPNGDVYTTVDKSLTIKDSPQREISHNTSPSGDIYLFIQPTESAATPASANRADTEYEHIDHSGQGNVYKNVTFA